MNEDAPLPPLPPWDGDVRAARALQDALAGRVRLVDEVREPSLVAGFDVGFEARKTITRAAAVLLDARTLEIVDAQVVRMPTRMPYIPGLLSFRELPALLEALAALPARPDLAFVDGLGIAHPRRFGIAAHFGVASGIATVGVAKSLYLGTHPPVPEAPGAHVPLHDGTERIGSMVRTKARCRPLVISPGHRVSLDGAVAHVLRALRGYRLPEPTRLADRIASRRDGR